MTTKKPQQKRNYLAIILAAVATLSVLITLASSWNSYSPINTLSTASTVLGVSLLPAAILMLLVFWLKMLVDAFQKRRVLWFIFILFTHIGGFFYFFIKKPNLKLSSFTETALTALALFTIMWGMQIYPGLINRINPVDVTNLQPTGRQFTAAINTKNLHGYTYHGTTTCREMKLENNTYYLQLEGGSVSVSGDSNLKLNYRFTAKSDVRSQEGGGWQASTEGRSLEVKDTAVSNLIGTFPDLQASPTGCEIEFWSSN
jgi:hypothetical protein